MVDLGQPQAREPAWCAGKSAGNYRKDSADIAFGMVNDVDFIALSFVRSPDDIQQLREFLEKTAVDKSRCQD